MMMVALSKWTRGLAGDVILFNCVISWTRHEDRCSTSARFGNHFGVKKTGRSARPTISCFVRTRMIIT